MCADAFVNQNLLTNIMDGFQKNILFNMSFEYPIIMLHTGREVSIIPTCTNIHHTHLFST